MTARVGRRRSRARGGLSEVLFWGVAGATGGGGRAPQVFRTTRT